MKNVEVNFMWVGENRTGTILKKKIIDEKSYYLISSYGTIYPVLTEEVTFINVPQIFAYTDGSAVSVGKNIGRGGFGVYFPNLDGKKHALSKSFAKTKTGRMEVAALLFALLTVEKKKNIVLSIYSDSEYVVKTVEFGRLKKWKEAGWTNSSGEVKNKDLWQLIFDFIEEHKETMMIELRHIKSHQLDKAKGKKRQELLKNPHVIGNAMADQLADYKRGMKIKL